LATLTDRLNDVWIEQLRQSGPEGDRALSELRDILRRGLGKALRQHPGADDAFLQDITQEALLKVMGGLSSFRGESRFTTWAITVGVRVAFSELRRARWRDVSLDHLNETGVAPSPSVEDSSSTQTEKDEMIALMHRVMERDLTERQRFLLVAELNGVPQAELCSRLGLNRNALYKLSHDARCKLKQGLLVVGVTEDDVREVFAIVS
jgi:RNA polymerase sigma-70 factor (ECF subfamily)